MSRLCNTAIQSARGYASFAEDDAGRIGFLADGATPLLVHQDGKIIPFVFPKDTIVLDKFLLAEKEQGRRRFTMAHEASHHILHLFYIICPQSDSK